MHSTTSKQNQPAGNTNPAAATGITVQAKLSVGAVNDPLEHEADAMADQVMSMQQVPAATNAAGSIQRKCQHCEEEETVHRKPLVSFIQRKESGSDTIAPESISDSINASKGNGSTMDSNTQSFMQNRFGTDFSGVKIHTGHSAIQMSSELNAKAFTVGSDIYFNEGQYDPGSHHGKHLLAHELTHTVQQSGSILNKINRKEECPAEKSTFSKQAAIQIFVIADDDGSNPTTATNMVNVDRVWEKCCIHMDVLPIKTIKKTAYKELDTDPNSLTTTTAEEQALSANKATNALNLFFIKTFKDTTGATNKNFYGGGYTLGNGGASPYTFIVEGALTSVVAHELGHGLGQSNHIAGTVMEGSNAYNAPNPEIVSGPLCTKVKSWPHLKDISTEPFACCLTY